MQESPSKQQCKAIQYVFFSFSIYIFSSKIQILDDGNDELLNDIVTTNLLGVIHSTKAAYRHFKKSNDYGHIFNMNSTTGHIVPNYISEPNWNLYPSTKHAMTAYTEVLQQELHYAKNTKVRVSVSSVLCIFWNIFDILH